MRFFSEAKGVFIASRMSLDEVKKVLEVHDKDKSHGLDGRTLEFFLELFDVKGGDLLYEIEESRTLGR